MENLQNKIIYTDHQYKLEVEKIFSQVGIYVEYSLPSEKILEELKKSNVGAGVGVGGIEGYIDLAKHTLGIFVSDPLIQGVVGNLIWDAIKTSYKSIIKRDIRKNSLIIQTDAFGYLKSSKSIAFIFPADLDDNGLDKAIKMIPEVRKRLLSFLEIADVSTGYDVIEAHFIFGRWDISVKYLPR